MNPTECSFNVEGCLSVIKEFLRCPICLDDFKSPIITPCAHIFCKFCLQLHIGKKRDASCPMCNRKVTSRSLKDSAKVTEITTACKEVILVYENELQTKVIAKHVPTNYLHLSQELTQQPLVTVPGTETEAAIAKNVPKKIKRSGRLTNIRLRSSDRVKRRRTNESAISSYDTLGTQPMRLEETDSVELGVSTNQTSVFRDANDLNDLFTSTQSTQPMEISCDNKLVRSMVGEGEEERTSMPKPRRAKPSGCCNSASIVRRVGKDALPPLPPSRQNVRLVAMTGQDLGPDENDPDHCGDKREIEEVSGRRPTSFSNSSKQVRRESNCSRVSSASGVLTRTHEVVCQVQSSTSFARVDSAPQGVTEIPDISAGVKRRRSRSSLSSLASKRTFSTSSLKTSGRLLAKYRQVGRSSSLVLNSGAKKSPKTPGWSRWQTMCKDFRRRSSKVQLALRKRTGSLSSLVSLPNFKTNEPSATAGDRAPSQTSWMKQIGSALRLKNNGPKPTKKSKVPLAFETQQDASTTHQPTQCFVVDTPMSQAVCEAPETTTEHCRFVLPLRRLLPLDLNRSLPTASSSTSSFLCLDRGSCRRPSSTRSSQALGTASSSIVPSTSSADPVADSWCSPHLHCGACGESLVVGADSFVDQVSMLTGITIDGLDHSMFEDVCSISSTYGRADQSGSTILDDSCMEGLVRTNLPHAKALTTDKRGLSTPTGTSQPNQLNAVCMNSLCTKRGIGLQGSAVVAAMSKASEASVPMPSSSTTPTVLSCNLTSADEDMLLQTPVGRLQTQPLSVGDGSQTIAVATPPPPPPTTTTADDGAQLTAAEEPVAVDHEDASGSLVVATMPPSDGLDNTLNNMPTFPDTYSSVMQTVDRERLRNECEELAAAVADLEQQLKAANSDEAKGTSQTIVQDTHTDENPLHREEEEPVGVPGLDPGSLITQLTCSSSHLEPTPDNLDVIPSSQNEEEFVGEASTMLTDATAGGRVESSQPIAEGPSVVLLTSQLERLAKQHTGNCGAGSTASSPPTPTPSSREFGRSEDTVSQLPETNLESQLQVTAVAGCNSKQVVSLLGNFPSRGGVLRPAVEVIPGNGLAVTGSSLSPKEVTLLHQFCKFFGVAEHATFLSGQTTHVVMKGQLDRPRVVIRTLKYFMGILNRAWIVNMDWVRQCLAAGVLVDESPFEIEGDTVCGDCHEGPRRSRLKVPALLHHHPPVGALSGDPSFTEDQSQQQHRPFTGLWLSAHDSLGLLSMGDFVQLARSGGATRVFERPADLAAAADAHAKSQGLGQKPGAVILTDPRAVNLNLAGCRELYRVYGIPVVSIEWMLTCISLYRRIPVGPLYRICPAASQAMKSTTALRPPLQSR